MLLRLELGRVQGPLASPRVVFVGLALELCELWLHVILSIELGSFLVAHGWVVQNAHDYATGLGVRPVLFALLLGFPERLPLAVDRGLLVEDGAEVLLVPLLLGCTLAERHL